MTNQDLDRWHQVVANKDLDLLQDLLHEDVEFHSPAVWAPKVGKPVAGFILQSAIDIFQDFTYHREWIDGDSCALEFSATVDGKNLKGIDLIRWNDEGQIVHFEVMIRPLNGLQALAGQMAQRLVDAGLVPPPQN